MANRTIANGGGNWSANATWVEGSPPDATMDVIATATSGNVTINTTSCVCKTMILTGYVGQMTFTSAQRLTVSGNVTFVAGMTLAGTGILRIGTTATITSGGLVFPGNLELNAGVTFTLGDNWTVTGTVTSSTVPFVLNSNTLTCNGSLTLQGGGSMSGTTAIVMGGTGTITTTNNSTTIANNLTFNSAGTITLGTNIAYLTGTITYTAGTIVNTGSTLTIRGSCTLNTGTMNWGDIACTITASTVTLSSALNLAGRLTTGSAATNTTFSGAFDIACANMTLNGQTTVYSGNVNVSGNLLVSATNTSNGAFNINVSGNVTVNNNVTISGTMTIVMNGTGTVSCATSLGTYNVAPGLITCGFKINTSGTITFGTIFGINASTTLTYTTGTLDFTTNNNLLYVNANMTIPTTFAWGGLLLAQGNTRTLTMSQDWTFSGDVVNIMENSGVATLTGAFNVSCRNLIIYGGTTTVFPSSKTLTVTNSILLGGQNLSQYTLSGATLQSGTASTSFNLKYQGTPANNKVYEMNFTDVDASTSTQRILNYNGGTLTRTTNIVNIPLPQTFTSAGVG